MTHPPTQTEIKAMLAGAGIRPDRRLGQHFLVDGNLMRLLVEEAGLGPRDTVIEVGAGIGNLTRLLLERAGWVVAIEIDPALVDIAREHLADATNFDLLRTDALKDKHHVSPALVERALVRQASVGGALKLVSNLPYAAATPLIAELLLAGPVPARLVFTVQEEVARRLAAAPGTRDYGHVSVVAQALGKVEVLRRLAPSVFWPRPRVTSAMVRIVPSAEQRRCIADATVFRGILEGLFAHRRKRAARSLALADPAGASPREWAARLEAAGLDPKARGETYSVEEIIRLANVLAEQQS
ncbi:MAG TPA: 16S rRNA (adenine(1518)-N(6)/adenine(1519)-N(6))-dimethyltransferase RsmA [Phycisphaerae bacterium]|nr:16S rRNA (adenine(1518)-N(6)/adenine(1519)-N(6))-dimethyltransferase RsmA [Phycisphaerae bacterium]